MRTITEYIQVLGSSGSSPFCFILFLNLSSNVCESSPLPPRLIPRFNFPRALRMCVFKRFSSTNGNPDQTSRGPLSVHVALVAQHEHHTHTCIVRGLFAHTIYFTTNRVHKGRSTTKGRCRKGAPEAHHNTSPTRMQARGHLPSPRFRPHSHFLVCHRRFAVDTIGLGVGVRPRAVGVSGVSLHDLRVLVFVVRANLVPDTRLARVTLPS